MSSDAVRELMQRALYLSAEVAAPFLVVVLIVGLVVGVIQAATQVQESALSFIPKLLGVSLVIIIAGPWALEHMVSFTRETIGQIASIHGDSE